MTRAAAEPFMVGMVGTSSTGADGAQACGVRLGATPARLPLPLSGGNFGGNSPSGRSQSVTIPRRCAVSWVARPPRKSGKGCRSHGCPFARASHSARRPPAPWGSGASAPRGRSNRETNSFTSTDRPHPDTSRRCRRAYPPRPCRRARTCRSLDRTPSPSGMRPPAGNRLLGQRRRPPIGRYWLAWPRSPGGPIVLAGKGTLTGDRQGGTAGAALRADCVRRAARPTRTATLGRGAASTCAARLAEDGLVERSSSASCREEEGKHQPGIQADSSHVSPRGNVHDTPSRSHDSTSPREHRNGRSLAWDGRHFVARSYRPRQPTA